MTLTNKTGLGNLVKMAGQTSGRSQVQLLDLYNRQVVRKATSVMLSLKQTVSLGHRCEVPAEKTTRHSVFIPAAIIVLNNTKP